MRSSHLAIILLALVLAGCASPPPKITTSDQVYASSTSDFDAYSGVQLIRSPVIEFVRFDTVTLVGQFEPGGKKPLIYLWVFRMDHEHFIRLTGASDNRAQKFPVGRIGLARETTEAFSNWTITVPVDYMEAHRASGLNLRLTGTGDPLFLVLGPIWIDGFMRKFDEELAKAAATPASARPGS